MTTIQAIFMQSGNVILLLPDNSFTDMYGIVYLCVIAMGSVSDST